mmetsp:Transcript_55937/g.93176  ORF Transcript_55937/g.93176 Transcript_55937/m.93176 type:complete len:211 (-) Transcript_55937:726-1358(-)
MRVVVVLVRLVPQSLARAQILDDVLVRVQHVLPRVITHLRRVLAIVVHGTHHRLLALLMHAIQFARAQIVLAKARRLMHHARAILLRHIVVGNHAKAMRAMREVREQRHILAADQLRALELRHNLALEAFASLHDRVLLLRLVQHLLAADIKIAILILKLDIRQLAIHTQRQIRRQCPWCRGPRQKRGIVLVAHNRECHHNGGIAPLLIV